MKIAEVRGRVEYWREVLNLRDWTISARWGTSAELAGSRATIEWDSHEFWVKILLDRRNEDQEYHVVHELLHLVMDDDRKTIERNLNRIALAFLSLKR